MNKKKSGCKPGEVKFDKHCVPVQKNGKINKKEANKVITVLKKKHINTVKEKEFWEWWQTQPLNSFSNVQGAYNYWRDKIKKG